MKDKGKDKWSRRTLVEVLFECKVRVVVEDPLGLDPVKTHTRGRNEMDGSVGV